MHDRTLTSTVIICAYSERRWTDLLSAVESVQRQTVRALEVMVVIDHNPGLFERACAEVSHATVILNSGPRGLSGARNSGISASSGDVIAFLDDDAIAEPDWLEHILRSFGREEVFAVGGAIEPIWEGGAPRWFPEEFLWVVGCSYRGLPECTSPVRNVIGANMAFRRRIIEHVGPFRSDIGRIGTKPVGCEETELCIRARQRHPDQLIVHVPEARVGHKVPASRATVRYFRARCFAEGQSKALVARYVGSTDGLASERAYTLRTLPRGFIRGLVDACRGDVTGVLRSAAIAAGFCTTALGYAIGRGRRSDEATSPAPSPLNVVPIPTGEFGS